MTTSSRCIFAPISIEISRELNSDPACEQGHITVTGLRSLAEAPSLLALSVLCFVALLRLRVVKE